MTGHVPLHSFQEILLVRGGERTVSVGEGVDTKEYVKSVDKRTLARTRPTQLFRPRFQLGLALGSFKYPRSLSRIRIGTPEPRSDLFIEHSRITAL